MASSIRLPKTPIVVADGKTVVVHFSEDSELIWGEEKTEEDAKRVAKELEVELRAVKYVKWHVKNFIHDMKEYLSENDIDEKLLDSVLIDGHAMAREELDKETVNSIIMSAERGLRRQVLSQLDADDYVV